MSIAIASRPLPPLGTLTLPAPLAISRCRLGNGLAVAAVEQGSVPMVHVRLRVPFAAASTIDTAAAALLAATATAGTARRGKAELAEAVQALGGRLSVGADTEGLLFRAEGLAPRLSELLGLLAEVVTSATYEPGEIAAVRDRLVNELELAWSHPVVLARAALLRRLFGAHPYAAEVPRTEDMAAVGAAEVRRLRDDALCPSGSTLVVVGDVRGDRALACAAEALSGWDAPGAATPAPPPEPPAPGPVGIVHRPGSVQSSIRMGGPALSRSDAGHAALHVATIVLGGTVSSRLLENLREDKGYTYAVRCGLVHAAAGSRVELELDVRSEVTAPALLEIAYELGRIATLPVSRDELTRARDYAIGASALGTATAGDLADEVVALEACGLGAGWLRDQPERLAAVTAEQVLDQARRVLAPSALATIVLGDAGEIEAPLRRLREVERC
jgi:predicted Zn-dependent peptidase